MTINTYKEGSGETYHIEINDNNGVTICDMDVVTDKHNQTTLTLNGYDGDDFFFEQFPCDNCGENKTN